VARLSKAGEPKLVVAAPRPGCKAPVAVAVVRL
jgi:hypothetical protein